MNGVSVNFPDVSLFLQSPLKSKRPVNGRGVNFSYFFLLQRAFAFSLLRNESPCSPPPYTLFLLQSAFCDRGSTNRTLSHIRAPFTKRKDLLRKRVRVDLSSGRRASKWPLTCAFAVPGEFP